jgi:hypothetical protein
MDQNEKSTDGFVEQDIEHKRFKPAPVKKKTAPDCETCTFYDYDEDYEAYVCTMNLDQVEMGAFLSGNTRACPYYRFYDEYKSVQKQN